MNPHLVTLGCSWCYGEGSGYEEGMTADDYDMIQHDSNICWQNGWRKKVVDHFGFGHTNLGEYGSGNDRQFRLATRFFLSKNFQRLRQNNVPVIVLWGTTSLNRYDVWLNEKNNYVKVLLNNADEDLIRYGTHEDIFAYAIKKYSYNETARLQELESNIMHWNQFFQLLGIKNFWYDTLASYDYRIKPKNFFDIEKYNRSLVSVCARKHRKDNKVKSLFQEDDFTYNIDNGVLNEHSYHPKKPYYKEIANYLIGKLEESL